MPQLIEAGKVYKAVPPLYSVATGKKTTYFTDQVDITRYIQKYFTQNHAITRAGKGGSKLTGKELTVLFLTNVDYVYELERIYKTYAMNPALLEMVLLNYYNKQSISSLKKEIKSNYRFMDVSKRNGVYVVEGTIDQSYELFITDKLINDCSLILNIISKNESTCYNMDGKEASLYEVMKEYEKCTPNSLQRYKGLGEMDVEEIIESTMSPFTNRTLVRYTLEDAKEEIEAIRDYETDLSKLLNLVGEVNRQDLLD
jgi:DNA gyrase/topoisomerase IV subunit B